LTRKRPYFGQEEWSFFFDKICSIFSMLLYCGRSLNLRVINFF
jgi:hypothetical protein